MGIDEIDLACFFPKPFRTLIDLFHQEFQLSIRRLIKKLDLVTKEEYLVQQRLLQEAYCELERLKQNRQT